MAGFPYTIPGKADFKKEYDFIWKLQLSEGFEKIGSPCRGSTTAKRETKNGEFNFKTRHSRGTVQ